MKSQTLLYYKILKVVTWIDSVPESTAFISRSVASADINGFIKNCANLLTVRNHPRALKNVRK